MGNLAQAEREYNQEPIKPNLNRHISLKEHLKLRDRVSQLEGEIELLKITINKTTNQ
jgi:hypothetical protein